MTNPTTSEGKRRGLERCSDASGVIAALAMDQRGSLRKALAKAGGKDESAVSDADLTAFKVAVAAKLTAHASAVLLDPLYGLPAAEARVRPSGLILAYEKSGYETSEEARLPALLPDWSAAKLKEAGADAVKVLVYHDPDGPDEVNDAKRAFVRKVGQECREADVPFFLEPVTYGAGSPEELAAGKPERVRRAVAEWTRPEYGIDVLKIEVPVPPSWLDAEALASQEHRRKVLAAFRSAVDAATRPVIFLSAGVDMELFVRSLELAAESGARFNGVLCGRATWKGGIAAYATGGKDALEDWLETDGAANIERLDRTLARTASPL